jgi:hypothetical protein
MNIDTTKNLHQISESCGDNEESFEEGQLFPFVNYQTQFATMMNM